MSPFCVYLCTCKDIEEARSISSILIREGLAACVNVLSGVESIYMWKNELCHDREVLLLIKSSEKKFDELQRCILQHHSYELPEIISIPITGGSQSYLKWLDMHLQNAL